MSSARCAHAPTARDCRDAPRVRLRVGRRRCVERARAGPRAPARRPRRFRGGHSRADRSAPVAMWASSSATPSAARSERASSTWLSASPASTPLVDWRGHVDAAGHELRTTVIAVADEIASAAELVMGKLDGVPAAVVRGLEVGGLGSARDARHAPERNLFPRGHQHRCGDGGGTPGIRRHYVHQGRPYVAPHLEMGRREEGRPWSLERWRSDCPHPPHARRIRRFVRVRPIADGGARMLVALAGCPAPAAPGPAGRPADIRDDDLDHCRQESRPRNLASLVRTRPSERPDRLPPLAEHARAAAGRRTARRSRRAGRRRRRYGDRARSDHTCRRAAGSRRRTRQRFDELDASATAKADGPAGVDLDRAADLVLPAARLGGTDWALDPPARQGETWTSPTADFDVKVGTPDGMRVFASGASIGRDAGTPPRCVTSLSRQGVSPLLGAPSAFLRPSS